MSKPFIEISAGNIVLHDGDRSVIKVWNRKEWIDAPDLVFQIVDLARNLADTNQFMAALYEYGLADQPTEQPSWVGKRRVYNILHTVTTDQGEYIPVICVEGESGFYRTDWAWGKDYHIAMQIAEEKNLALGIEPKEAALIVLSTIKLH